MCFVRNKCLHKVIRQYQCSQILCYSYQKRFLDLRRDFFYIIPTKEVLEWYLLYDWPFKSLDFKIPAPEMILKNLHR